MLLNPQQQLFAQSCNNYTSLNPWPDREHNRRHRQPRRTALCQKVPGPQKRTACRLSHVMKLDLRDNWTIEPTRICEATNFDSVITTSSQKPRGPRVLLAYANADRIKKQSLSRRCETSGLLRQIAKAENRDGVADISKNDTSV